MSHVHSRVTTAWTATSSRSQEVILHAGPCRCRGKPLAVRGEGQRLLHDFEGAAFDEYPAERPGAREKQGKGEGREAGSGHGFSFGVALRRIRKERDPKFRPCAAQREGATTQTFIRGSPSRAASAVGRRAAPERLRDVRPDDFPGDPARAEPVGRGERLRRRRRGIRSAPSRPKDALQRRVGRRSGRKATSLPNPTPFPRSPGEGG